MFPIFVCSQMLRENQKAQTTNDYEWFYFILLNLTEQNAMKQTSS